MNIESNMDSLNVSDNLQIKETDASVDFDIKIVLKHNQSISFRLRRLLYPDEFFDD